MSGRHAASSSGSVSDLPSSRLGAIASFSTRFEGARRVHQPDVQQKHISPCHSPYPKPQGSVRPQHKRQVRFMKPAVVNKLEEVLEQAIADALESEKIKKLPVKPRREITHLMAKAAVAVYEGVVEGKNG